MSKVFSFHFIETYFIFYFSFFDYRLVGLAQELLSFPDNSSSKESTGQCRRRRRSRLNPRFREDPPEEKMTTHSNTLAWEIPWTEEPAGPQSMGSRRVGHDWATKHTHTQELFAFFWVSKIFSPVLNLNKKNHSVSCHI